MFEIDSIKNNTLAIQQQTENMRNNKINGMDLGDYIFHRTITHVDPIE